MAAMTAKQFIETFFIAQVGEVVDTIPYMAFVVMGIGIEYLGKCLTKEKLQDEEKSRERFEDAISTIPALSKYKPFTGKGNKFDLYSSLRCGLAHAAAPKYPIKLSSKNEEAHLTIHDNGNRLNLRCEDFYDDFKRACEEVIQMPDPIMSKLSRPFLEF